MRALKAHHVGLFPGANLLAGADDLLHEVAVPAHTACAHLTVELQCLAPLPVAWRHMMTHQTRVPQLQCSCQYRPVAWADKLRCICRIETPMLLQYCYSGR